MQQISASLKRNGATPSESQRPLSTLTYVGSRQLRSEPGLDRDRFRCCPFARLARSTWLRLRRELEPHANSDRLALFHTGSPAFRNPSKSFSRLAGSAIGITRR